MSLDANPPVLAESAEGGLVILDPPEAVADRQRLGVLLLIAADVAFVLSMVFTYLYLRGLNTEGAWISPDHPRTANTALGWVIAGVMLLSWGAYRWGESGAAAGERARLVLGVAAANLLLVVDGGLQVYQMTSSGMHAMDDAYASAFMAMTGYHVFHLALTLFIGVAIWNRARLGRFEGNPVHVRLVGYWWSWVAVSAVITAAVTALTTSGHVVP